MADEGNDVLKRLIGKGLPEKITHPSVTGATYPYTATTIKEKKPTEQELAGKYAGIRYPTGATKDEIKAAVEPLAKEQVIPKAEEAPKEEKFQALPTAERVKAVQTLAAAGHVFTNEDLKKFYGTGLPPASMLDTLMERANTISSYLTSGVYKDRAAKAARQELTQLHETARSLIGVTGEAEYKKALTEEKKAETVAIPEKLKIEHEKAAALGTRWEAQAEEKRLTERSKYIEKRKSEGRTDAEAEADAGTYFDPSWESAGGGATPGKVTHQNVIDEVSKGSGWKESTKHPGMMEGTIRGKKVLWDKTKNTFHTE